MRIRLATSDDIDAMHRVRVAVRENRLEDPSLIQPHHYRSMLHERGRGWVAESDGAIAGFAFCDLARSNIWASFVDPEREGQGIGRRLHDTMLDWLFSAGVQHVWLSTEPGTRAGRFYRSAGWQFSGEEPNGEHRFHMSREPWRARASGRGKVQCGPHGVGIG